MKNATAAVSLSAALVADYKKGADSALAAGKTYAAAGAAIAKALFPTKAIKAAEKKAAADSAAAALNAAEWGTFWADMAKAKGLKNKDGTPAAAKALNGSALQSAMRAAGYNVGMKAGVFSVTPAGKKKARKGKSLTDILAGLVAEYGADAIAKALPDAIAKAKEAA